MIEIKIDDITAVEDGIVTTAVRRFKPGVKVGDTIELLEPEHRKSFSGVINSIDADGHVDIKVDWASERTHG